MTKITISPVEYAKITVRHSRDRMERRIWTKKKLIFCLCKNHTIQKKSYSVSTMTISIILASQDVLKFIRK